MQVSSSAKDSNYSPLLLASALLIIVPLGAGILRVLLNLSMSASFATCVCAVFAVAALYFSIRRVNFSRTEFSISAVLAAVLCVVFYARMYHPLFYGLPSVGGGDAGNHVYWSRVFLTSDARIYHGLIYFYSMSYLVSFLGLDSSFADFRAAYYLTSFLFFILLAVVIVRALPKRTPARWLAYTALTAGLLLMPLERIVFPIFHYLQADGFYPQVASLSLLMLIAACYAVLRERRWRVFAVLGGMLLYRYSYALNLGDLILASSLILAGEARALDGALRFGLSLIALAAAAVAAYVYSRLLTVFGLEGSVIELAQATLMQGELAMYFGLAAAVYALLKQPERCGELIRLLIFSIFFGLAAFAFKFLYLFFSAESSYYLQKYSYHSLVLTTCCAVTAAAVLLPTLPPALKQRRFLQVCALTAFGTTSLYGMWAVSTALQPIRVSYEARAGRLRASSLTKLVDKNVWSEITETLARNRKKFGGFITPSWPQSNFTNASFGLYGELPLYKTGSVLIEPGHCVFWMSDQISLQEYKSGASEKLMKTVAELSSAAQAKHVYYTDPISGIERRLSHLCVE